VLELRRGRPLLLREKFIFTVFELHGRLPPTLCQRLYSVELLQYAQLATDVLDTKM
jgi:hypothetical protein